MRVCVCVCGCTELCCCTCRSASALWFVVEWLPWARSAQAQAQAQAQRQAQATPLYAPGSYVLGWWVQEGDPFIVWTVHHRPG